jgi:hypothetical protein
MSGATSGFARNALGILSCLWPPEKEGAVDNNQRPARIAQPVELVHRSGRTSADASLAWRLNSSEKGGT